MNARNEEVRTGIGYDSLKILKFGGLIDSLYNKMVKRIIPNISYPFRDNIIPKLYQLQSWGKLKELPVWYI